MHVRPRGGAEAGSEEVGSMRCSSSTAEGVQAIRPLVRQRTPPLLLRGRPFALPQLLRRPRAPVASVNHSGRLRNRRARHPQTIAALMQHTLRALHCGAELGMAGYAFGYPPKATGSNGLRLSSVRSPTSAAPPRVISPIGCGCCCHSSVLRGALMYAL